jgi:hypothetical protein
MVVRFEVVFWMELIDSAQRLGEARQYTIFIGLMMIEHRRNFLIENAHRLRIAGVYDGN